MQYSWFLRSGIPIASMSGEQVIRSCIVWWFVQVSRIYLVWYEFLIISMVMATSAHDPERWARFVPALSDFHYISMVQWLSQRWRNFMYGVPGDPSCRCEDWLHCPETKSKQAYYQYNILAQTSEMIVIRLIKYLVGSMEYTGWPCSTTLTLVQSHLLKCIFCSLAICCYYKLTYCSGEKW